MMYYLACLFTGYLSRALTGPSFTIFRSSATFCNCLSSSLMAFRLILRKRYISLSFEISNLPCNVFFSEKITCRRIEIRELIIQLILIITTTNLLLSTSKSCCLFSSNALRRLSRPSMAFC